MLGKQRRVIIRCRNGFKDDFILVDSGRGFDLDLAKKHLRLQHKKWHEGMGKKVECDQVNFDYEEG